MRQQNILVAGVGGQGILTISAILGRAAVKEGLHVKQSEVHGMAQRGGAVVSHIRLSERPIFSGLIPQGHASLLIACEPMEGLRAFPFLSADGFVVANINPVRNIPDYPPVEALLEQIRQWPNHLLIDADALGRKAGSTKAANSVLLGAAAPHLIVPAATLREAIGDFFATRGIDAKEFNLTAFDLGLSNSR